MTDDNAVESVSERNVMAASPEPLSAGLVLRPDGLVNQHAQVGAGGVELSGTPGAPRPAAELDQAGGNYFVEGLPVEIHCHSMGGVDFSDFRDLDLAALNTVAAAEGVACVPTMYLAHEKLAEFVAFMRRFHELRRRGALPFVPAVALEGPLLASHGGTPATTVWPPTKAEWEQLAACGPLGLVYVVISPDGLTPDSGLYGELGRQHPDLRWIVRTLVESGVRPALGHYTKLEPQRATELTYEIVDVAWQGESPITGARVITDHLFNDMPLKIRHAFRTRKARAERDALIASYDLPSWNLADLPEQVGEVPAAIMRLCHEGKVASCINFDAEHVDLAIAARAVEVIGEGRVMLMTDRCDVARLGGQALHHEAENTLWYQNGGVVAAGSQPLDRQLQNARRAGVAEGRLWDIASFTAYSTLGLDRDPWLNPGRTGSFLSAEAEAEPSDGRPSYRRHAVVASSPAFAEDRTGPRHDRTIPVVRAG
jgi:N-acetylglucosamine-6-phosphate deacetylase